MKWLKGLLGVIVGLFVIAGLAVFAAGFGDGPSGLIRGGAFTSGQPATSEPDWSFVKDYETVEFQLLEPAQSRTTWIVVIDNRVFIPCGYMDTAWGRIWKQWPIQAEQDGRAILRVDQTLYPRQLKRIKTDPALDQVLTELSRKYVNLPISAEAVANDSLWIFELLPREGTNDPSA